MATKSYLIAIKRKGHVKCYTCEKQFIEGDTLHAILRKCGHGLSKFYHEECYEKSCY